MTTVVNILVKTTSCITTIKYFVIVLWFNQNNYIIVINLDIHLKLTCVLQLLPPVCCNKTLLLLN